MKHLPTNVLEDVNRYIVHDLRHVFAQISSLSYLINQDIGMLSDTKLRMHNHLVQEAAQQGLAMTLELLLPESDEQAGEIKPVESLNTFLTDLDDVYRLESIRRRIHFDIILLEEDQSVTIGYCDLKRMLDNLVNNAFKFTPAGGQVIVRASSEPGVLIIQVQDNGIGISENQRKTIFTEAGSRVGSYGLRGEPSCGLGLAIVKQLVRKNAGTLCCYPANPGTIFNLEFPNTGLT